MGTNYYAVIESEMGACPTCGRDGHLVEKRWHIGKSSYGWCFALHIGSEREPHIPESLEAWKSTWKSSIRIENEYGETMTLESMEKIITGRDHPHANKDRDWFISNHAVPGPNNLARHSLGDHCIGHGEGTWDLITGEFS